MPETLVVAVAAAEDRAVVVVVIYKAFGLVPDYGAEATGGNLDGTVFLDHTARATAEAVAHEAATVDGDTGVAHTSHVDPVPAVGSELLDIALSAAVDVAGAGVVEAAQSVDERPGTAIVDTGLAELVGGAGVGVAVDY